MGSINDRCGFKVLHVGVVCYLARTTGTSMAAPDLEGVQSEYVNESRGLGYKSVCPWSDLFQNRRDTFRISDSSHDAFRSVNVG